MLRIRMRHILIHLTTPRSSARHYMMGSGSASRRDTTDKVAMPLFLINFKVSTF